jgi:hypothetical protein
MGKAGRVLPELGDGPENGGGDVRTWSRVNGFTPEGMMVTAFSTMDATL